MSDSPETHSHDRFAEIVALIDRVAFLDTDTVETITYTGDTAVVHHADGDRSRVRLSTEDGELSIASIVRCTTCMPSITPADEVYTTPNGTTIVHGPGRETHVRNSL